MNGETSIIEIVPGLYLIGDSPSPSSPGKADAFTYFMTRDAQSPAVLPTLDETWEDPSLIGWYIFLAEEIVDAEDFVSNGRLSLPSLADNPAQPNSRVLIWMANVTRFTDSPWMLIYAQTGTPINRTNPSVAIFNFGQFGLTIPPGANVALNGSSLQITYSAQGPSLILYGGIAPRYQPYPPNTENWIFNLDFTGPLSGSFVQTQMAFDYGTLQENFACSFRYFYADADGNPQSLEYAFTPSAQPGPISGFLGLNFYLDPIHPTDSGRTRIELDLGTDYPYQTNSAALRAPYFGTTAGGAIVLAPAMPGTPSSSLPPGFAFCAMPPLPSSPLEQAFYLAPVGTFAVVQIDSVGSPGSPTDSALWMPGLFAQEFLELSLGDQIELVSNQPAYAPSFASAEGGSQSAALDAKYTTSWVRFPVNIAETARGYFGQPSASVFYGARQSDPFPRALSAQLSNLDAPMLFPVGPYGGVFADPLSQNVSAQTFAAYEATVLSGARHAQAPPLEGGPRFHAPAARQSRFSRTLSTPDPVAYGATPQGFLAGLDGDGGWLSLTLARSPQDPTQTISFEGTGSPNGRVNPLLASALLEGQLFLVISDPANLGQFNKWVSLGGFNFTLDVDDGSTLGTVLIFKYNTSQTLADLATRTDLWSNRQNFIKDLAGTQGIILNALDQAGIHSPAGSHVGASSPFAYFRQIATDPSWTGVLALNCAIDGNGMPLDLQILLGGIDGQLRAHHLGIQSTPSVAHETSPGAQSSSLFGVIHYPSNASQVAPPSPGAALSYEVEILNVVFSNSKITQFHVVAGLTANELFGRAVELTGVSPGYSPANTLSIPGQYQMQGAVGVVTFATAQPFVYTFPIPNGATRVLRQIVFDSASLVPVSSTPQGAGTAVVARFQLSGGLFFNTEPFPGTGIDLFSYGSGSNGLQFANLTVELNFTLDANGVAVDKSVAFDPSLITVTPSAGAIREKSLLYSLPLQLSAFDSGTALQSIAGSSTPLHVLELEGHPGEVVTPATPVVVSPQTAPGSWPYVTNAPAFALEFDLPLGSLGSLSDVHAGIMARLLLGWGPSELVPDADAAAILVQLPQLSAGYGGFNLQGILRTTFGDANLLKVELENGPVYAMMFSNIKLSVLGFSFPPGYIINFILFAGTPAQPGPTNSSNVAWFLAAQPPGSPS